VACNSKRYFLKTSDCLSEKYQSLEYKLNLIVVHHCVYVCMCVYVFMCVCVCVCMWCVCVCAYTCVCNSKMLNFIIIYLLFVLIVMLKRHPHSKFVMQEFYFKCANHHTLDDDSSVPLHMIRVNDVGVECIVCADVK